MDPLNGEIMREGEVNRKRGREGDREGERECCSFGVRAGTHEKVNY